MTDSSPLAPTGRGALDALVDACVRRPLLCLALLVAVQALPALHARDLIAGDEVRHADALENLLEGGDAFVLRMNGKAYPDKPPLWFWFVAGISTVTGLGVAASFFLASAASAFLFAAATWFVARRVAGADARTSFVASLAALTVPLTAALSQTTRMDLLFATFVVLSQAALFVGLVRPSPSRWVPVGALLAVVAAGIKGPLGLVLPLVAALAWAGWTGRWRRLVALDVAGGVLVAGGGVALYLVGLASSQGWPWVENMLEQQVLRRAVKAKQNAQPFFYYAALLLPVTAPWSWGILSLPWDRAKDLVRTTRAARREDASGTTFLAVSAVSGFVLLSALSGKLPVYLAPLVPPLAILLARPLVGRGPGAASKAWTAAAVAAVVAAGAVPFLPDLASSGSDWDFEVAGLVPVALVLAASSVALFVVRKRDVVVASFVAALGLVAATTAVETLVMPSLDAYASPRAHAEAIRTLADRGYAPVVFRTYEGTYTFHAGIDLPHTDDPKYVKAVLDRHDRVVAAMPRKYFDRHAGKEFAGLRVLSERWLVDAPVVLVVKDDGSTPPLPGVGR